LKAGLLLVDLQEDFFRRRGLVPDRTRLIEGVGAWLKAFRGAGLPVIHVRTLVREDGCDRMPHWKANDTRLCIAGSPGAAAPGGLVEAPGEPVVAKRFYSAFETPELARLLAERGVERLYVAGLYSHACVRQTALDAYARGLSVAVAGDAVASTEPAHAAITLDYLQSHGIPVVDLHGASVELGLTHRVETSPGGAWVMRNPADWGQELFQVGATSAIEILERCNRARDRQRVWSRLPLSRRREALGEWVSALIAARTEIVAQIVLDVGKPVSFAQAEFDYAIALARHTLGTMDADVEAHLGFDVRHAPLGVVGIITPWNNPLAIALGKIGPCLAWGNGAVWKPALPGSRIAETVKRITERALPAAPLELVCGGNGTGALLLARGDLDGVAFTGSTRQGMEVARLFPDRAKPLQAELGGNNAVIIAADADFTRAARELAAAAYGFAGQRCTAPRRIVVEAGIRAAFQVALLESIDGLALGEPDDPTVHVGPLVSMERREAILATLANCKGELLRGGSVPRGYEHGAWLLPTLIGDPAQHSEIVQQETFGPVALIQSARDMDEAIEMANGVVQGLVASIYADNADIVQKARSECAAGIFCANRSPVPIAVAAPFLGWKHSGFGFPEHGRWDREMYSRPQARY
jgi:acyl-CoA reductase-like NAD-dependent aldehyde dehydrogenase/nicotinamidase-related amidase